MSTRLIWIVATVMVMSALVPAVKAATGNSSDDRAEELRRRIEARQALRDAQRGDPAPPQHEGQEPDEPAAKPGVDADAFLAQIPVPAGLRLGMPLAEAVTALTGDGYALRPVSGCSLERHEPGTPRIEVHLKGEPVRPASSPTPQLMLRCKAPEDTVVSQVSLRQYPERASDSVMLEPEMARIAEKIGNTGDCANASTCTWTSPGSERTIRSISVTLSRSWGREVVVEAEMSNLRPVLSDRMPNVEAIRQEAQTLCESHDPSSVFSRLVNCDCTAEKFTGAYARGEVERVSAGLVSRYAEGCPAGRDRLIPYFAERCMEQFGNPRQPDLVRQWAHDGGCSCTGDKAAEMHLTRPALNYGSLARLIHVAGPECGLDQARAGRLPEIPRAPSATALPEAKVDVAELGAPAEGLRPLRVWLKAGWPVWDPSRQGANISIGPTFDYETQAAAIERFVKLVLLSEEPPLMNEDRSALVLASENLSDLAAAQLLQGKCLEYRLLPTHCQWKGTDEFSRNAAAKQFRANYGPALVRYGSGLPRGIVAVETAFLEEYDPSRGGFPLRLSADHRQFSTLLTLAADSHFGKGTAEVQGGMPEPFWSMDADTAEAVLEHLPRGRPQVQLAVRYRIVGTRPPQGLEHSRRVMTLEPERIDVFADPLLTRELGELTAPRTPGKAKSVPVSEAAQTAKQYGGSTEPALLPLKMDMVDNRMLIDTERTDNMTRDRLVRWANLVLLNEHPHLIDRPENARIYARQNLGGMVTSKNQWAGKDEFNRNRTAKHFEETGAAQIKALARRTSMPFEVVVLRQVDLLAYDFERQMFPIRPAQDGEGDVFGRLNDDGADLLLPHHYHSVGGPLLIKWRDGLLSPKEWLIAPADAQNAVVGLPPRPNGTRAVWYASIARVAGLGKGPRGHATLEGELLETRLYADREMTRLITYLPTAGQ